MKLLLSVLIVLFGFSAQAEEGTLLGQFFFSPEFRYERGEDQAWEARLPLSLALGARQDVWSGLIEYSRFDQKTGNATLNVTTVTEQLLLWAQRDVGSFELMSSWIVHLYGGAGAGVFQRQVETHLYTSSRSDKSNYYGVVAVSAGMQSRWFIFESLPRLGFAAGLEGRVLFSQEFDPNPQGSVLARLGILF